MTYTGLKEIIATYTGLERDALHIHAALFIYILAMLLFRQSRRSLLPWIIVLGIELANEAHDLWENWLRDSIWTIGEGAKDLWNTMLWPTILMIVGRYTNWLSRRPKTGDQEAGTPASEPDAPHVGD